MTPIVTKDDPNGCFQRALPDEPLFTLLARDKQAPALVRKWATDRARDGNAPVHYAGEPEPAHPDQDAIDHANYVAARMEVWRYENEGKWRVPTPEPKAEEPEVAPWNQERFAFKPEERRDII